MSKKRKYTEKLIFSKYLANKCPVCDGIVNQDSEIARVESGGQLMAKHFSCRNCHSMYTVGYNCNQFHIKSEIMLNAVYK